MTGAAPVRTRFELSAGGVVVRHRKQGWETVLASRRNREGQLVWGLAKGLVEKGEAVEAAAAREVLEETGIPVRVLESLGEISYWFVWDGARVRKVVRFFLMEPKGRATGKRDSEMEEVRWFLLDEAIDVAGYRSEKDVLRRARTAVAPDEPSA